ncbi:MAG: hypothetical protein IJX87_02770 [Clostridia bacterium]|nr:hypothetical protein [Clostridia bacterium]
MVGAILIFILIVLVIIGVFYIGGTLLAIFLGVGMLIGVAYALFVYIRAFINECRSIGSVTGSNGVTQFLLRWLHLFLRSSWSALKDNWDIAQTAIIKSKGEKLFKKAMWLFVAPTVLVFGTALIVAVGVLQLFILLAIAAALLTLVFTVFVLLFAAAFVYGIVDTVKNFIAIAPSNGNIFTALDFSKYPLFSELFPVRSKDYFTTLFGYCRDLCVENWSQGATNFSTAKTYSAISFWRYFLFLSPFALTILSAVTVALFTVFFTILYVPMLVVNVLWICIAKIFFR